MFGVRYISFGITYLSDMRFDTLEDAEDYVRQLRTLAFCHSAWVVKTV